MRVDTFRVPLNRRHIGAKKQIVRHGEGVLADSGIGEVLLGALRPVNGINATRPALGECHNFSGGSAESWVAKMSALS